MRTVIRAALMFNLAIILYLPIVSCAAQFGAQAEPEEGGAKNNRVFDAQYLPISVVPTKMFDHAPEYSLVGAGDIQLPWQDAPVPYLAVGDLTVSNLQVCKADSDWICFWLVNGDIEFPDFSIPVSIATDMDDSADTTTVWERQGYRYQVARLIGVSVFPDDKDEVWLSIDSYSVESEAGNPEANFVWSNERGLLFITLYRQNMAESVTWASSDHCGFGGISGHCERR